MNRLPDPRERPWLTVAQVAEITGEGEKAIRAAVEAGQLPSIRVARYIRIPTAALLEVCHITPDIDEARAPTLAIVETAASTAKVPCHDAPPPAC